MRLGGLDVAEIPQFTEMTPTFTSTSSCRPGRGIKIIPLSTQQSAYHGREFVVENLLLIRMKRSATLATFITPSRTVVASSLSVVVRLSLLIALHGLNSVLHRVIADGDRNAASKMF